jgi:hypothetical protein
VNGPGGRREAPGLAAGKEIFEVADIHGDNATVCGPVQS